jgi:hypothetical protein
MPDSNGNITCDPNFAYDYPVYGYYHLDFGSHCRDKGDSEGDYSSETDIDDEDRDGDGYVDIGADEVTCEVVSDPNDWNADGIINLEEFEIFSLAWLTDVTDENYNPLCDFDDDEDVDIVDFRGFVTNWLWTACWHENYQEIWMMSSGGGESLLLSEPIAIVSEPTTPVEKSIEEQLADAKVIVDWLDEVSKNKEILEYIDKDVWSDFVDKIYDWLDNLEDMAELDLKG